MGQSLQCVRVSCSACDNKEDAKREATLTKEAKKSDDEPPNNTTTLPDDNGDKKEPVDEANNKDNKNTDDFDDTIWNDNHVDDVDLDDLDNKDAKREATLTKEAINSENEPPNSTTTQPDDNGDKKESVDEANNDDIHDNKNTDDFADFDDLDDLDDVNFDDLHKKYPVSDLPTITRTESLPPVLGARVTHNKLELEEPTTQLEQYTICNKSDKPQSYTEPVTGYGGLVLYEYDGKTEWTLNGIQCKTGLVLLKKSADLPKSSVGQIHGGVYKSFFDESVGIKIVASGFAYYNNKWVFKSRAFNLEGNEHIMRDSEIKWLKKALENWCDHGVAETKVDPVLNIYIEEKGEYIPKS